jgi:hypothetical protein
MQGEAACRLGAVDARIAYPCYKSLDPFIDVARLTALDSAVAETIRRHIAAGADHPFSTGPYKLDERGPQRAGSRMIYLSQSTRPDSYFDLDDSALWLRSPAAAEFAELMAFIDTLPFRETGRMLVIYDDVARAGPAHRDHVETDVCHEFVWFRTNLGKRFYMLNERTGVKKYVESYSAWFDTVNQFHGSEPCDGLSFSVRVDGVFNDAFRSLIPAAPANRASAPACSPDET